MKIPIKKMKMSNRTMTMRTIDGKAKSLKLNVLPRKRERKKMPIQTTMREERGDNTESPRSERENQAGRVNNGCGEDAGERASINLHGYLLPVVNRCLSNT